MPDPRDDLIRRGDVLDMIDAESHGGEGLAIIDSRDIHALPADDDVARRFKRGESIEVMAWEVYRANFAKVHGVSMSECIELVEDALRRSMNRGRRA